MNRFQQRDQSWNWRPVPYRGGDQSREAAAKSSKHWISINPPVQPDKDRVIFRISTALHKPWVVLGNMTGRSTAPDHGGIQKNMLLPSVTLTLPVKEREPALQTRSSYSEGPFLIDADRFLCERPGDSDPDETEQKDGDEGCSHLSFLRQNGVMQAVRRGVRSHRASWQSLSTAMRNQLGTRGWDPVRHCLRELQLGCGGCLLRCPCGSVPEHEHEGDQGPVSRQAVDVELIAASAWVVEADVARRRRMFACMCKTGQQRTQGHRESDRRGGRMEAGRNGAGIKVGTRRPGATGALMGSRQISLESNDTRITRTRCATPNAQLCAAPRAPATIIISKKRGGRAPGRGLSRAGLRFLAGFEVTARAVFGARQGRRCS